MEIVVIFFKLSSLETNFQILDWGKRGTSKNGQASFPSGWFSMRAVSKLRLSPSSRIRSFALLFFPKSESGKIITKLEFPLDDIFMIFRVKAHQRVMACEAVLDDKSRHWSFRVHGEKHIMPHTEADDYVDICLCLV